MSILLMISMILHYFQSKNKVSLRNLSMVLRQLGKTPEEKADFIQKSVDHAKEAVQMDFKDGTSWCKLLMK